MAGTLGRSFLRKEDQRLLTGRGKFSGDGNHQDVAHAVMVRSPHAHAKIGNIEKSREFYERAIRVNPFNPFVHMRLMTIHQKLGQNKEKELQAKLFGYID